MEFGDDHLKLLTDAACGGWYLDEENVAAAGELVRAGYATPYFDHETLFVRATEKGVNALRARGLIKRRAPGDYGGGTWQRV